MDDFFFQTDMVIRSNIQKDVRLNKTITQGTISMCFKAYSCKMTSEVEYDNLR